MDNGIAPGRLRSTGYYFPKVLKFYDLKNESLTRVVFLFILVITFVSQWIPLSKIEGIMPLLTSPGTSEAQAAMEKLVNLYLVKIASILLLNIFSTLYLAAYIKDLKGELYTLQSCISLVGWNLLKVTIALLLYSLLMVLGAFLIIPLIIFYLIFFFNSCFILDRGMGIMKAFKASTRLVYGRKMQMFGIMLVYNILFFSLPLIFSAVDNIIISVFIGSFIGTMTNLMYQRLTALLYIDLAYRPKSPQVEEERQQ